MVTMHGFFNLKETQAEADFATRYNAFAAHLIDNNFIVGARVHKRAPASGYDSTPPETTYYVSMDFVDLAQSQACWDYIETPPAAALKLHRDVYGRIKDARFFLSEAL